MTTCCWCHLLRLAFAVFSALEIIFQISAPIAVVQSYVPLLWIVVGNVVTLITTSVLVYGTLLNRNRRWWWTWVTINILFVILRIGLLVMGALGPNSNPIPTDYGAGLVAAIILGIVWFAIATIQAYFLTILSLLTLDTPSWECPIY